MQPGESRERLQSNRARLCRRRGGREGGREKSGEGCMKKRREEKRRERNERMGSDRRAGEKREGNMSEYIDRLKNGRGWWSQRE